MMGDERFRCRARERLVWGGPALAGLSFAVALAAFAWALFAYQGSVRGWAEQDLQSRADLAAVLLAEPLRTLDFRTVDAFGARLRGEGLRLRICPGARFAERERGFYDTAGETDADWLFKVARTDDYAVGVGRPATDLMRPYRRALGVIALAGLAGVAAVVLIFVALVRQRLRIRELARLEEFRRAFVADVSHEIRTPLTGMLGAADLMPADDPLAGMVRREGKRLEGLVQQILDLSRLERPGAILRLEEADLGEIARDVAARLGASCEAGACRWTCDAQLVTQALENLVSNAHRHSGSDDVRILLETAGDGVRLSVEDRGCGVPPEHAARIFERFHRIDPARAAASGGAGLGLAIVRRIARLHGGEATYAPVRPRGSRFTIFLPRRGNI